MFPPRVGVTVCKKLDRPAIRPHAFFGGEVECAHVKRRLGQVGARVHQRAPAARARDAIVNDQRVHNAGIGQAFQLRVDMFDVARMKAHRLAVNLSGETAGVGAPVHQLIEGDIQRSLFHPQVQRVVDVDEDGLLDIFAADYSALTVSYYRNLTQAGEAFIRADVNTDGSTNVADVIFLLAFLFSGGAVPGCMDAGDINDDGSNNISDAITLLAVLFSGGGPTPAPVGSCGLDPTQDNLDCLDSGESCS